jgi:tetratricopeptide (TPR) repeat protein
MLLKAVILSVLLFCASLTACAKSETGKQSEIDDGRGNRWDDRLRFLTRPSALDPGNVAGGLKQEGLKNIDRAITLNPKFALAWKSRGLFLQVLGKLTEAVTSYEKSLALEFDPDTEKTKEAIKAKL